MLRTALDRLFRPAATVACASPDRPEKKPCGAPAGSEMAAPYTLCEAGIDSTALAAARALRPDTRSAKRSGVPPVPGSTGVTGSTGSTGSTGGTRARVNVSVTCLSSAE
ncbi:Uncharacterised protein [Achromobacter sp. 2789STDY5608621]|nr:Uncharacterised protein [Achromobacter sp. 2789STDY5608621]